MDIPKRWILSELYSSSPDNFLMLLINLPENMLVADAITITITVIMIMIMINITIMTIIIILILIVIIAIT